MCGIAGIWSRERASGNDELRATVQEMASRLRHRGPDDQGTWTDAEVGIALASRRLAILDLSPAGHQPMISASSRYVVTFNGEIYNYEELRHQMESDVTDSVLALRGHSDTEVMLAAFDHWGVEPTLPRLNGMFALGVWDRKERVLYLVRDRLGEKPLYYGWIGNTLLFASELKALHAHPAFRPEIDREALAFHLRYNCVPAPFSIYQGVHKLPAATFLRIQSDMRGEVLPVAYWSLLEVARHGIENPYRGSDAQAVEQFDGLLREAVKLRMISDVPLGAFLSGGIDSSTVVALMQAQSNRPVRTFSIGFHEANYNEAKDAHAVARHLRTEHTELYVTPQQTMAVIQRLPTLYDEPFADSSQIPTFLVSQLARQYVTVALSGDGGDEVFGGYNRHTWGRRIWNTMRWVPMLLRRAAAAGITHLAPKTWDALFRQLSWSMPRSWRQRLPGDKLHKLSSVIALDSPMSMYLRMASHWDQPESVVRGVPQDFTNRVVLREWQDFPEFEDKAMYLDAVTYLVNDILTKLDRASMGVSLEARVPYLDPSVVEFAWSLPLSMKVRGQQGKWILRQLLDRYVPRELVERPKMGFGIPIDDWLRGPLREWAESLLDESRLRQEGFFH
ncbi:MAG TPA: asparagine synthase (glutamine-hydrolyzing), partial [Terriglobales bacterium]|nr:asparagine synthase (glutamine-hydrolyzing) [Terriglobales bacterium]